METQNLRQLRYQLAKGIFCGLFSCLSFSACTLLNSRPHTSPAAQSGEVKLPQAVPVEIAMDINRINSGHSAEVEMDQSQPLARRFHPNNANQTYEQTPGQRPGQRAVASDSTNSDEQEAGTEEEPVKSIVNKSSLRHKRKKGGKTEQYTVQSGDTLMKIAFNKLGNLYRWREIYQDNKNIIHNYNFITPGMVLTIHGVQYIVIEHNGQAYLIRRTDTLAKISKKLYGTPAFWRDLWKNNPQLIHDPNKIYAGFTLYYRPLNSTLSSKSSPSDKRDPAAAP